MRHALAYHITWGTYGTRLHGDPRGTVDREHNAPETPVLGPDETRRAVEASNRAFPPIRLTREQQIHLESILPAVCERGHWTYHTAAGAPDHVHVVLATGSTPETARRLLKRWIGQSLSEMWPLPEGQCWWAECGSIKWIIDPLHFDRALAYVKRQRATPAQSSAPAV